MRVVVTGQVGLDKKPFLQRVAQIARQQSCDLRVCNVGDMMYAEAPDVARGKILDLPLSRLTSLRRSVFKDILALCGRHPNVLINTHATFRWRHGLFYAFDYDQMKELDADLYIALVDNVDRVHYRLTRDGHVDHTLKDLMVWREEEVLATELLSQIVRGHGCFYVVPRGSAVWGPEAQAAEADGGRDDTAAQVLVRLLFHPQIKRTYLSFPMSHVDDAPEMLVPIENFRRELKRHFTCFDPGELEENYLCRLALKAAEQGRRTVAIGPPEARCVMETAQLLDIIADIDGQIYARDFKLIDQSDMIVSLIPVLSDGRPGLSSGVERELQHAHEATRDVFVIWQPDRPPSPFITETATRIFGSVAEAIQFFLDSGYLPPGPSGALFG